MTITSKDTRQRLLDLLEKCPECVGGEMFRVARILHGSQLSRIIARDAMVRWLLTRGLIQICGGPGKPCPDDNPYAVEPYDYEDNIVGNFVASTLTDALISAVEAVLEEGDTLKAEEQANDL